MALVHLLQCFVGGKPIPIGRAHMGWTTQEMAAARAVAQAVQLQGWEKIEEYNAALQRWQAFTAAHHLPQLEAELAALEPKLNEARRQRKLLGSPPRIGHEPSERPERRASGFWSLFGRSAVSHLTPTAEGAQAQQDVEKAQHELETLAHEQGILKQQLADLHRKREVAAALAERPECIWLVFPVTDSESMRELAQHERGYGWYNVPRLVLSCPVGIIPEETEGRPGERLSQRWYFRTGLLAGQLLGPQERPADRQELQELEDWITANSAQASALAMWLARYKVTY